MTALERLVDSDRINKAGERPPRSDCSILRIDLEAIRWRAAWVSPLSRNHHKK
jgi:hypothetical protein